MSRFIQPSDYNASIHREILNSLLRTDAPTYDPQIIEICENRAIEEMTSYLSGRYDCERIFSECQSCQRNSLILMFALDITIYHIYCQHNPYKISETVKSRYERALEWLRGVQKGDLSIPNAPKLPDYVAEGNSPWQISSDTVRPTLL